MHDRSNAARTFAGIAVTLGAVGLGAVLTARAKATPPSPDDAPTYTARDGGGEFDVQGRTVTIGKPRQELYAFWRDFSNLPKVMKNLIEIRALPEAGRHEWRIRAPGGQIVDVVTETTDDIEGEIIGWKSVPGSDIETEGRVCFTDAPGDRGTRVSLIVAYKPPAGAMGKIFAKAFQREPQIQARRDLKRFKMLMETGEITTSARTRKQNEQPRAEEV